ncbi:CopG family transcriptional regulator [Brenneria roseae subsp. roseae]|uniref:CopG family ribbon-helix-helix protein n=1 Tax=Brenneria roseae TaxID=1509241 RepID=UPI000D61C2AC|nr:ribbon-helix-helix domain-containing protein [Brenneria roseae]PWC14592.1 CopG family transcriptional regulator [Brenneria roseae subsp. roseae]
MAVSVKLDTQLEARLARLAAKRKRTKHYLMKQAIVSYVDTEEQKERLRQQAQSSYVNYLNTGNHLTGKEVVDFLRSDKNGDLPECHK